MNIAFYIASAVAIVSTLMVITRLNAVHALLYLIVSLLAVAVIFFLLGAPFVAALEVIIYAGAIMMLFVFAVMMLNLGPRAAAQEREWLPARAWIGPALLGAALLVELGVVLARGSGTTGAAAGPAQVGALLFGPYLLVTELAAFLLFAGLVGAQYLGRRLDRREA
ncbi:MAG: NADH-quinone oxidoreductase subunit J [Candidatus Methylomirabilales bacterium]